MAVNTYDAALVKSALSEGKRLSGRNLYDIRPVSIETNLIEAAEGSAIVTLGNTKVIAGVKAEIGSPYSDSPDEGSITIDVELSPMADPNFESGPPTDTSIELSRVVDRGIRESKAIDFKSLCIVPGEKVWVLYCDIYIINNDGNLFDACSLAALAAFKTSHLPKLDDESNIVKDEKGPDLKLTNIPVLFTFAKIGDKIVLDPDLKEDLATETRFSVAIMNDGNLTAMQKGLAGKFTMSDVEMMIETAKKSYKVQAEYFKKL